jgi:peroxiredoxin
MQKHTDSPLIPDLTRAIDDGAAAHLKGLAMPRILLPSTFGGFFDLSHLTAPRTVIYCFPMTSVPGKSLPEGWDSIPGASDGLGRTCGFQERYGELLGLKSEVFGLSTQTTEYQGEMAEKLHLPFEILSDAKFRFCDALRLPTFEVTGMRFLKHLTLVIRGAQIEHVFYPVFAPDQSADQVVQWLEDHPLG